MTETAEADMNADSNTASMSSSGASIHTIAFDGYADSGISKGIDTLAMPDNRPVQLKGQKTTLSAAIEPKAQKAPSAFSKRNLT